MKYIPLHAPQDTVSGYSFEESADTVAVTARPKPKTVSGILLVPTLSIFRDSKALPPMRI